MKPHSRRIPFALNAFLPECAESVRSCIETGPLSGNGPRTKEVEAHLSRLASVPALLVTSATHSLEMMALLADLRPGDEVICPSFTFVSTANAFALRGARIRFADNDAYGQLLPAEIERLLTPRTRAVISVDYAGNSPDYDLLRAACEKHQLLLFEDAAQAIGARYKHHALGACGDAACFSFHETKNVGCGEGGALLSRHPEMISRAEILREKGTNRSQFFQGLADKYTWVDLGSSYVLSEMNAAYLLPQLARFEAIAARRRTLWERYRLELGPTLDKTGVDYIRVPPHNSPNHHLFGLVLPDGEMRRAFISAMNDLNVATPFHYVALHRSPAGLRHSEGHPEALPGCDRLADRLVRLPLFFNLSDESQAFVIDAVKTWLTTQMGALK
jgi:dTDP-4-amino-4,6-dideoxygalactose transaminase